LWPRNQIEIAILGSLALKHHVSVDFVQNADVYCLSNPRDSQRVPPPEIDELKIRQINYSFFTSIQSNLKPQVVIGIPTSLKPWQGTENCKYFGQMQRYLLKYVNLSCFSHKLIVCSSGFFPLCSEETACSVAHEASRRRGTRLGTRI
jgi:hypothetical protein